MSLPVILLILGATLGLFTTAWLLLTQPRQRLLATRMAQFDALGPIARGVPTDDDLARPFSERVIRPVFNRLGSLLTRGRSAQDLGHIQQQLDRAGGVWGLSPGGFVAAQLLFTAAGAGIGFALFTVTGVELTIGLLMVVGMAVLGFLIPRMKLKTAIKARKTEILDGMPNALDLLTIGVEAGLAFDASMLRVAEKFDNALSEELNQVLTEMKLGRPRREALRALADRCDLEDLTNFCQAVIQSEQMGTSLAQTLRIQSEEMRRKRRQRAEEAGAKAPLKMLLPMVGCIFPTLFIVLLGPAALEVLSQFGSNH